MRIRKSRNRRGIASLEFVLVFPFLMMLGAGIIVTGRAGVLKTSVAIKVRSGAWSGRENMVPGGELGLNWNPASGKQVHAEARTVRGILRNSQQKNATASTFVYAGSWDHRSVGFGTGRPTMLPHLDVLARMISFGALPGGESLDSVLKPVAQVVDFVTDDATLVAGRAANAPVIGAGLWIEGTLLTPLRGVVILLEIANLNPFANFNPEIALFEVFINAAEGMAEAAHERPGTWLPDKLKDLGKILEIDELKKFVPKDIFKGK